VAKTKEQQIQDAREAERLLRDETLQRVFAEVEQHVFDSLKSAQLGDMDELVQLQAELHGVTVLRRRLRIWVDAGIIAEKGAK